MRTYLKRDEEEAILQHLPEEFWFATERGRVDVLEDVACVSGGPIDPSAIVAVVDGRVLYGRPTFQANPAGAYTYLEFVDGKEVDRFSSEDQWLTRKDLEAS